MSDYCEIRGQKHIMIAEGTTDDPPTVASIEACVKKRDYRADNIDIWYDDLQEIWRWKCNITAP